MRDLRRINFRTRAKHGRAPLILESVSDFEVPTELMRLTDGFLVYVWDDERNQRIVATDVPPSRGQVNWSFSIKAEKINSSLMDSVKTLVFRDQRYQVLTAQFFLEQPSHWELVAVISGQVAA